MRIPFQRNRGIRHGNRSHPNLMKLDSLLLTYEGWEDDFKKTENAHFDGNDYGFERLLQTLEKKQRVHNGDRSHNRLVALDALVLSYPGYEEDILAAEKSHFDWEEGTDFWDKIKGMKNKQRIHLGDRSNPNLVRLDALNVGYHGWEEDFRRAEDAHNDGFAWGFERMLQKMEKKQRVHEGDRSHPRLVALDALVLSYPGWQADISKAEETHYEWEEGSDFWDMLKGLKNKESIFLGDRSHPNLVRLDALALTYPGWEDDKKKAEESHNDGFDWGFERRLKKLKKKQRAHDGDRSHPQLRALDSTSLSYPGWEVDFRDAEETHFEWEEGSDFWDKLKGMKHKQQFYHGSNNKRKNKKDTPKMRDKENVENGAKGSSDDDYLGACIICGVEDKSHVFVPCGHLCACDDCAQLSLQANGRCPICRSRSTQAIRVFFS